MPVPGLNLSRWWGGGARLRLRNPVPKSPPLSPLWPKARASSGAIAVHPEGDVWFLFHGFLIDGVPPCIGVWLKPRPGSVFAFTRVPPARPSSGCGPHLMADMARPLCATARARATVTRRAGAGAPRQVAAIGEAARRSVRIPPARRLRGMGRLTGPISRHGRANSCRRRRPRAASTLCNSSSTRSLRVSGLRDASSLSWGAGFP